MSNKKTKNCEIAVVGVGCFYPGAKSPKELWENILSRKQQFREMPDVRLPNHEYYHADPLTPDKTYQNKSAVIDGYAFDWLNRRIPKKTYESTDIVHWLALDTAIQALENAGYNRDNIPKEKAGVVLGNTLTGEFTRANQMLLRWPYVRKTLRASLQSKGLSHLAPSIEESMEKMYKSVFAPVTEDTLAGGLANTIAGRVCNYLDIHGGGYIVDGACSSSLLAITNAANYLELGQMDMVIAGGVDVSLDTFELIGFAKTGALTKDEMRVYDKQGKGFLPGEGCGMVVLKRLEDAKRDGDTILSTLMGWGISSDGKGGITAPSAVGQSKALTRAYQKADFDTEKLNFIEGHGTGTTVGDKVELAGITLALNANKTLPKRNCGVTSFKSIVGHTKAAAGVGAFIKTVMALNQRIMPPTAGLKEFNPIFEDDAKTIFPLVNGQIKDPKSTLYAGVSAMGFGGINSHTLLRSQDAPIENLKPSIAAEKLLVSNQDSELFTFTGDSKQELIEAVELAQSIAKGISYAELVDLAYTINKKANLKQSYRAAIVASTPFDLERKLTVLNGAIKTSKNNESLSVEQGQISFGKRKENLKIGAAFPGQGAQRLNMGQKLKQRHDWVEDLIDKADQLLKEDKFDAVKDKIFHTIEKTIDPNDKLKLNKRLKQTQHAQPAIVIISLAWYKYLEKLGVTIDYSIGHSLGELTSFYAAGHITEETLIKFAGFRGKTMANCGSGTMASLVCSKNKAQELIDQSKGYATIANINAPEQTVISGEASAIEEIIELAEKAHIAAVSLPVSAAFHSKLINETAKAIQAYGLLNKSNYSENNGCKVISSVSAKEINEALDLNSYFADQSVNQVNFIDAVNTISKKCDIMVEIGPGKVLSGLVRNITKEVKCYPIAASYDFDNALNIMVANLFVAGANIKFDLLYENRLIRPFVPASERNFLVNPLERPFPDFSQEETLSASIQDLELFSSQLDLSSSTIKDYLNQRGAFIQDIIASDMKHMADFKAIPQPARKIPSEQSSNQQIKKSTTTNKSIDIKAVLYNKLEAATGFPPTAYKPEMKLLDDFNLDSIKAGTLLSGLSKELKLNGNFKANEFANASIETILNALDKVVPKIQSSPTANKQTSVKETVLDVIIEKTGFPKEAIAMDFKLLDDLNLDSIKAGTVLSELSKKFQINGNIQPSNHANASLQQIVNTIEKALPKTNIQDSDNSTVLDVPSIVYELIEEKTGFPQSDLQNEFRLLDDLNLDSIKAGSLLAELSKKLEISNKIEASKYANASIQEIVNVLQEYAAPQQDKPEHQVKQKAVKNDTWVNAFEANPVPIKIDVDAQTIGEYWNNKQIVFIYEKEENNEELLKKWHKTNNKIECFDASNHDFDQSPNADILIVCIPEGKDIAAIEATTHLLSNIATQANFRQADILFIQPDNRSVQNGNSANNDNCISAQGFASSLHHERPEQKIRVLSHSSKTSLDRIYIMAIQSLSIEKSYQAIFLNEENTSELQYTIAAHKKESKPIVLDSNDVVLITGGAKGITAECGIALSKKFGCKMALIGSTSLAAGDTGITNTLKRYKKEGLKANYFSCDIGNHEAVMELKNNIENTLGTVTAIVHGAGRNIPRLAETVSGEDAFSEIKPKVLGLYNLLNAFKNNALKQVTAFTSIIGVTGMQGNSWYAFANETTDLLLRQFKATNNTQTLSLAYSVWSDVGMGARMGSVEHLANMGIESIAPHKGIQHFIKWFEQAANDQQLVIASKLGGLDTWIRKDKQLPKAKRYLESIKYFEPGIELVAHAYLDREDDKYTDDHNYRGSLLFPTVFGIEAMAQAVAAVAGVTKFASLTMENISLTQPIVVPEKGKTTIEIKAEVMEAKSDNEIRIKAGIATENTNFESDHFSAEFIIGKKVINKTFSIKHEHALMIEPKTDLYSWLLFQGKTFQLIDKTYTITEKLAVFSTQTPNTDTSELCLSEKVYKPFIIGSPLLRDTLLQSFQLSLTKKLVLPVRIKRWTILNPSLQTQGGLVQCAFVKQEGKTYDCDVHFTTKTGDLIEQIEGYQVQELGDQSSNPSPEEIATIDAITNSKLKEAFADLENKVKLPDVLLHKTEKSFHLMDEKERHSVEQELLENNHDVLSKHKLSIDDVKLDFMESGKPNIAHPQYNASIAHTNTWLLMTFGKMPQACDIELIEHRENDIWKNLLGFDLFNLANERSINNDISFDEAATKLWSVKESAFKHFGIMADEITFYEQFNHHVIFKACHEGESIYISTIDLEIFPKVKAIVAIEVQLINKKPTKEKTKSLTPENRSHKESIYNADHGKFKYDFLATFKDCRGFYGKTYFTNFPLWMGSLRENVLSPVKDELLRDLASGDYGMVTNDSSVHLYNEADSLDNFIGTLSFTDKCNFNESFMDFKYEWFKQKNDGSLIKVADCYLSTTWVKILDRGIVKKDPLPKYFVDFLEKYHNPEHKKDFKQELKGQVYFTQKDLGRTLYLSAALPRPEIELACKKYQTGMQNGNSVGNLYYSNYYDWQAKTLESYLFGLIPDLFLQNGKAGEYFCLECNVNHLQEAMPFEEIEVKMYLQAVYEHGITLFFEYYSLGHGDRRKLSYGSNTLLWCKRSKAENIPEVMNTPERLLEITPKNKVVN